MSAALLVAMLVVSFAYTTFVWSLAEDPHLTHPERVSMIALTSLCSIPLLAIGWFCFAELLLS